MWRGVRHPPRDVFKYLYSQRLKYMVGEILTIFYSHFYDHYLHLGTTLMNFIFNFQIEQYFRALPQNKVPKIGTPGEKYRDKQLVYQLPKQDLALSYCKNVEAKDHQSYEDFINARNEIALDIAYVKESSAGSIVS